MDMNLVQQLRNETGAGVIDIKKALDEAKQDYKVAIELLRKRGQKIAAKKQGRVATQGLVEAYIHADGKVGVLVKVNCETDFVARTDSFKQLTHQLAMHIAAYSPAYLNSTDVPADIINKEKEIHQAVIAKEGKPAAVVEKIIAGKLQKYYAEVCLMQQPFVMDEKKTVQAFVTEKIAELGENIQVTDFKRISL